MQLIGKIDVGAYAESLRRDIAKKMPQAVEILGNEVDALTPEDTRELLGNNRREVRSEPGAIIGEVSNDTEYAQYVEFGVQGQTFNYHKPKGTTVFRGIGNRTFTRALLAAQQKIISLFKS